MKDWTCADRISDTIVNLLNAECKKPDLDPVQLLAGQLLALRTYIATAPRGILSLEVLKMAVDQMLHEITLPYRVPATPQQTVRLPAKPPRRPSLDCQGIDPASGRGKANIRAAE